MTPEQRRLVERHLLEQGSPLSASEYSELRRQMAADGELTRYFNEVAATRVDDGGNPVMSPRQFRTILRVAETKRLAGRSPSSRRRFWLGGFVTAVGLTAIALVAFRTETPSRSVVLRGGDSSNVLPSFLCSQTPVRSEEASCPPGEPMRLQGTLFPREINRPHLAVVTCDEMFSCSFIAQREQGRDEGAVIVQVGSIRPLRVFALWTEDVLTSAHLTQAGQRLRMAGFGLRESPKLPMGRALQSSIYLIP